MDFHIFIRINLSKNTSKNKDFPYCIIKINLFKKIIINKPLN